MRKNKINLNYLMSERNNQKSNYDINLGILKIYLSFLVVNTHCLKRQNIENKYLLKFLVNNLHVPIFFIISFYFCHKIFLSKNIEKIKQRFERILLPYFVWPIIIWIFNNLFSFFFKIKLLNSFNELKIQLLTGHCFMTVLWFQYNLIFTTLLIVIISFLFKHNTILILINLWNISYFLQFSNINFLFFSKYDFYIKYTFGRFFEILPYCITGFIFSSLKIIDKLKKYRFISFYILISILIFIKRCNIFVRIKGFAYEGFNLYIASVSFFIIIKIIPINQNNKVIIKIVKILSNKTSGIYYLHIPIKNYLTNCFLLVKKRTILGSIIIYLFCYFISTIGLLLFKNTKLRHLFE